MRQGAQVEEFLGLTSSFFFQSNYSLISLRTLGNPGSAVSAVIAEDLGSLHSNSCSVTVHTKMIMLFATVEFYAVLSILKLQVLLFALLCL